MNPDHPARRCVITGLSGSGKSELFYRQIRSWPARWKFIFDPDQKAARALSWPVAVDEDQIVRLASHSRPVCYDPAPMFRADKRAAFDWFCGVVYRMARTVNGGKLLACDEVQKFQTIGRGGVPTSVIELMDDGRKEEIDVLFVCQKLNKLNDEIRGQITDAVTFRHTSAKQIQWLVDECDFDPDEIAQLPEIGHCIHRDTARGRVSFSGNSRKLVSLWGCHASPDSKRQTQPA